MNYETLLRIAGPPVKAHVLLSKRDEKPGMVSFDEVKQAIALLAGYKHISAQTELGAGCWAGTTDEGECPYVIVVGSRETDEWNGTAKLEKINHPRCKGHLLDFESVAKSWYDFDTLQHNLSTCGDQCAVETMNEAISLFDLFGWVHPSSAVTMAGLVLATWVQSLWGWRPQVAVTGPTKAGKTTLFRALTAIFGNLTIDSSGSSAAGIRQHLKMSSQVVLCDEFEDSAYRKQEADLVRRASSPSVQHCRTVTAARG
jgi:hypothetical protein